MEQTMDHKYNKMRCLQLLISKESIEKNSNLTFREYNIKKYFDLETQLMYVKDFLIWESSFKGYFVLFQKFKNKSITGEFFVDEFFDQFQKDEELLKSFVFSPENIEKLNVHPKSSGFYSFLYRISMECDLFLPDSNERLSSEIDETQLRSYITQIFYQIESFL